VARCVTACNFLRLAPGDTTEKLAVIGKDDRLLAAAEPVDRTALKHSNLDAIDLQPELGRRFRRR
jgi:hypothetical protein